MLERMSYVIYRHADLAAARTFLLDFGMLIVDETPERIYFRGYGDEPFIYLAEKSDSSSFVGIAFEASSSADLEKIAARFGVEVEDSPRPGGGRRITIADPDGKPVEIVHGAQKVEPIPTREALAFNSGGKRNRLGRMPLFDDVPEPILKLDHTVMSSPEPERMIDWLVAEFGAYPSDIIKTEDGRPLLAFLRFPKGSEYIEHHHVAVSLGGEPGAQHTCFEAIDLDAVFMGHRYLERKGHKAAWGPVRHSLGGAISDYWRDPSGFILEHVTDGDYVNDEATTGIWPITNEMATMQWATHPLPADFIE
jgi:catechol 2,3-dioxygenase-like lactoylglutathione lyase family enzyme